MTNVVLDASAVLALLLGEPGCEKVIAAGWCEDKASAGDIPLLIRWRSSTDPIGSASSTAGSIATTTTSEVNRLHYIDHLVAPVYGPEIACRWNGWPAGRYVAMRDTSSRPGMNVNCEPAT